MKLVAAKCPSCGANIKLDRDLKFTKCEYCNSEITVEEAVENLLKVELKDNPTFDNYLKLGERYFNNHEYAEAYKAYSNAEEIEPDNPLVVLRKGLCRSMVSDYNNFDVSSAINGLKTSYDLMKKMSFSKKDINRSIDETGAVLYVSRNYILDIYKNNKLNKAQITGFIERLEACLDGFIYLDSIVDSDKNLEIKILDAIIETINNLLGDGKYNLSSSYVTELTNKKREYETKRSKYGEYNKKYEPIKKKDKVVAVENKTSKVKDILCYVMIFFLFIMFLGAIFNNEGILAILLWLLTIVSFIPKIKKELVKKSGANIGKIIVGLRVVLVFACFMFLASGPVAFENTFKGEDGTKITLSSGSITIEKGDTVKTGKYHWDSKDNDYYIHVQIDNGEDEEYRFRENSEGGNLCLMKDKECSIVYLPVD